MLLLGITAPVYVPSPQIEVTDDIDMNGKTLTGLAAPVNATDAIRKSYADAVIGLLSSLTIDVNKDWQGKNISNLGVVSLRKVTTAAGTTEKHHAVTTEVSISATITPTLVDTVTIPQGYWGLNDNIFSVSASLKSNDATRAVYVYFYVNDVLIYTGSTASTSYVTISSDLSMQSGDVLKIYYACHDTSTGAPSIAYLKDTYIKCTEISEILGLGSPNNLDPVW